MALAAVNGAQVASSGGCLVCGKPKSEKATYCSDHCRAVRWGQKQTFEPQRRLEFGPTASQEAQKRGRKRQAVLDCLRSRQMVRTWELMVAGGSGFSSRLAELRREGFEIRCTPDDDGAWYELVRES